MCKKIDHIINSLYKDSTLPLKDKVPLLLRKFIPATALMCDAQINNQNQLTWAVIYQNGSDTFVYISDNEVYIDGSHENEILRRMENFVAQLSKRAIQGALFKQLSLGLDY